MMKKIHLNLDSMAAATSRRQTPVYQNQIYVQINYIPVSNNENHLRQDSLRRIMAFTIANFLAFLQIRTVGNPIISMACGFSLLGYYLAYRAKTRFPNYASQLAFLMAAFNSFTVASLPSLLLPKSGCLVTVITFIVLLCDLFYPKIKILFDKYVISLFWGGPLRGNMATGCQLLPLTL